MDKLLKNNWVVKILSFVIALMLYAMVSANGQPSSGTSDLLGSDDQQTTITENLKIKYNQDDYVVTGAPQSVKVQLQGPSDLILKAKLLGTRSAYIDLTKKKSGTYNVKVQTSGFPAGLRVTPNPDSVTVTLQRKVTKQLPVSIDILNKSNIASGYVLSDPTIEPKTVSVTGGQDMVDAIAFIKGVVNVQGADGTMDKTVALNAYDNNGNQLNVDISPSTVHVNIPILKVAKQVTLSATSSGNPADGYSVGSISVSPKEVMVYGKKSGNLDTIDEIGPLSVPVDGLAASKTFKVKVPVPDGADRVSPKTVSVTVSIVKGNEGQGTSGNSDQSNSDQTTSGKAANQDTSQTQGSTSFQNIPIHIQGLSSGKRAVIEQPDSVSVQVKGSQSDLKGLSASDIQASVNAAGLSNGEHQVTIQLELPKGLTGEASPESAKVTISDKKTSS